MFSKQTFITVLLVCCLLAATTVIGHDVIYHISTSPHFLFEDGTATVTCNNGRSFTHHVISYSDGSVHSDYWDPDPRPSELKLSSNLHGWGWYRTKLSGTVDGTSVRKRHL